MTRHVFQAHTVLNAFIYGAAAFFVAIGAVRAFSASGMILAV